MYDYFNGILVQSSPSTAVIEVAGIGYKVSIPMSTFAKLDQIGQKIKLYLSFVVREQSQTLYGFITMEERDLFEVFLTVSGIGPKTAIALIGCLPLSQLHIAIQNQDVPVLSKVPGIGKKTAERLIVELKDKLPKMGNHPFPDLGALAIPEGKQKITDAMSALTNLGYSQTVAKQALKKTLDEHSDDIDLAALITATLKHI